MLKAWAARGRFEAGTNFKAWTFTILRNLYFSQVRRRRFVGEWDDLAADRLLAEPASQDKVIELRDVTRALQQLPAPQREAIILVGAGGVSYEQAAEIAGWRSAPSKAEWRAHARRSQQFWTAASSKRHVMISRITTMLSSASSPISKSFSRIAPVVRRPPSPLDCAVASVSPASPFFLASIGPKSERGLAACDRAEIAVRLVSTAFRPDWAVECSAFR